MKKTQIWLFISVLLISLPACTQAEITSTATQTLPATPTFFSTATATIVSPTPPVVEAVIPQHLLDLETQFSLMGYEFLPNADNQIQLVDKTNPEVVVFTVEDESTIRLNVMSSVDMDKEGKVIPGPMTEVSLPVESVDIFDASIALGVNNIITFSSNSEVTHFWLPTVEASMTPIIGATDPEMLRPENISQVPESQLADVWTSRLLYSEILRAEPFDDDTLVPDRFVYWYNRIRTDANISVMGERDDDNEFDHPRVSDVTQETDYREFTDIYMSELDGKPVIILTQKTAHPDGKRVVHFHYIIGLEWSAEDFEVKGILLNLIYSIINNKNSDEYADYLISPVVATTGDGAQFNPGVDSMGEKIPTAGLPLYNGEYVQNQPQLVHPDLVLKLNEFLSQNHRSDILREIPVTDEALIKLQSMPLLAEYYVPSNSYFSNSN